MIRLCTRVELEKWQEFSNQYIERQVGVKYYSDVRYGRYRYNFVIEQSFMGMNFSYYVGYKHNSEKKAQKYNLVIEYNPNKCYPVDILQNILKTFFTENFEVKSCDIAIDMEINIMDIIVDKGQKESWSEFGRGNGDNRTKYYGQGTGRVKLYNKAREQGILDKDLTRYEVSYKLNINRNDFIYNQLQDVMNENIPRIYQIENKIVIDPTLRALHYAVMNGFNINELSRAYKKKILEVIKQQEIEIDNKKIKECIRQYILLYDDWLENKIVLFNGQISKSSKKSIT